ncbi:MAG: Ribonuclease [Candidatus Paceibacter sp.]|jgi:ribonuclease P protein component|nr:Ribonuclease [Candidatus Paceibacter sp.]
MLPSSRRVSRILFEKTLHNGKVFHGAFFSLRIGSVEGEPTKAAMVVSKKIDKRATKRNTLRRRGYRVLAKHIGSMQPGFTVLFFAKKGAEAVSEQVLEASMVESLKQAKVYIS